jgi:malonyl-CoA decarboxylase
VHQIDGWDDLHRRLQPDRRCFAFFHPQLPDEPLIFVEVALLPAMPGAIAPLIDKKAEPLPAQRWRVAAFYSISNCQPGLRGVSLGNFLIKRVAEELKRELPQLKTFCTLSPIPGFAGWLRKAEPAGLPRIAKPAAQRAQEALDLLRAQHDLSQPLSADALQAMPEEEQAALRRLVAAFLLHCTPTPQGDPVARFHLDNGARLERIHTLANLSARGRAESCGMMVNYLYDLDRVEANHESFTNGEMSASRPVRSLL